jgi:hypothetical protein
MDAGRFEPHYDEIRQADQVQIYESVMADVENRVTTGLLRATKFVKDNRLLPRGFDKKTAVPDVAVRGGAQEDENFVGEADRVRYSIDVRGASPPFRVEAELRYQPIGFRWADNLRSYDAPEPRRFVNYYIGMSEFSAALLARAHQDVP